ncbi:MAG: ATP-binding protein [Actinomycetota bacterium]|nr:MAG: signal transduction histidine [Actinomycetota bacterium]MDO8949103.1 ATP-binding protein [Actinomycetota bacterium]MDP3630270.1 ATP-binding protein [Actinomycetota bacterium]
MKVAPRARWYVRIFQFSPLVAGAFLAFVFLAVPAGLRAQIDTVRQYQAMAKSAGEAPIESYDEKVYAEQWLASMRAYDKVGDSSDISGSFERMTQSLLDAAAPKASELFSSTGEPVAPNWSSDDAMFASAREFESQYGAEVFVYFIPDPPLPSLVASSVPRPDLLPNAIDVRANYAPLESWGKRWEVAELVQDPWKITWMQNRQTYGDHAPFPGNFNTSTGIGGEKRAIYEGIRAPGGTAYLYSWITSPDMMTEEVPPPGANLESDWQFFTVDPKDSDYQTHLDEVARQFNADIYVAGPLDLRLIPLRVPAGVSTADAEALGSTVWPPDATRGSSYYGAIEQVPADARQFAPDARWMMTSTVQGYGANIALMQADFLATGQTPPQTLVVLATMKQSPSALAVSDLSPLQRAWQDVQVFLGLRQQAFLGSAGLLLAMALVASPAAFVIERRRISQALVLEEMERVQQDAHDKVYNRLSALSKRVELASETISSEVSRSLDGVAEDIRDTVTDLQDILGDARQRTASIAGKDPLRSQLESVAREQAARLNIDVDLAVADAMPTLSAQTGWDLQCVLEEAISNAVEHGGATHVGANVEIDGDMLVLKVTDNGTGMPATDLEQLPEASMGLRGMHTRAGRHGGTVSVGSTPVGTVVKLRVPLKRSQGDT